MDSSLYFNGHLWLLHCVLRVDGDNTHLSFPLSIFFIVLLLAHTVIDCLRIHFFVLQIQVLVTNKKIFLRPYRRPGDNIVHPNL